MMKLTATPTHDFPALPFAPHDTDHVCDEVEALTRDNSPELGLYLFSRIVSAMQRGGLDIAGQMDCLIDVLYVTADPLPY